MGFFSSAKGSIGSWKPSKTLSETIQNPGKGISDLYKKSAGKAWTDVVRDPVAKATGGGGSSGDLSAEDMQGIQDKYAAPTRPEYQSALDPATGQLKSGYELSAPDKLSFNAPQMKNMEAAQQMKNIGMGKAESPWLKLQLQQNELDKNKALEGMRGMQGGQLADARSQLAMRGGMSTGARERLGRAGAIQGMRSAQDIYGQAGQSNLAAQMQAGKDQQSMLMGAAGMEADLGKFGASGQFDADRLNAANQMATGQFNIGNKMNQLGGLNEANYKYYTEDQKARAANIMADTMGRTGGSSGGFLGKIFGG